MPSKQSTAARKNIKKAANAARKKRTSSSKIRALRASNRKAFDRLTLSY
jgi:hypothetical protein